MPLYCPICRKALGAHDGLILQTLGDLQTVVTHVRLGRSWCHSALFNTDLSVRKPRKPRRR
jgi:hypothetical protein